MHTQNQDLSASIQTKVNQAPELKHKHIAILRLSALGDCINAFGIIGGLLKQYPELKITWLIDKRFYPLFSPLTKEYNARFNLITLDFKTRGYKTLIDLYHEVKKQHFDVLLDMQTSIKASLCALILKAPIKIGYDKIRSREGQKFFVNQYINSPQDNHVLSSFLAFCERSHYKIDAPYWDFKLEASLLNQVKKLLQEHSHNKKLPRYLIALNPCSAKAQKNWTKEGYTKLIHYLTTLPHLQDASLVLLGGNSTLEQEYCTSLSTLSPKIINLQGKTNLRELAGILSLCSFTIGPDCGTMHLSSALHTPVIGLFAVHNPQRVGPWNFMHLNVSCYEQLALQELKSNHKDSIPWRYRIKDPQAMHNIDFNLVIAKINYVLEHYKLKALD